MLDPSKERFIQENNVKDMDCENMHGKKSVSKQLSLVGRRLHLRPFSRSDLPYIQKWSNDSEIRRLTGEVSPMSQAEAKRFYKELRADKDRLWFVIVLKKGKRVIGEAGLLRMFRPWRCTDMTVIIGEKDAWEKGYGSEAGRLLLSHAFDRLGFHRVSVGVVGLNERALRYWESLGFKREGAERDGYYCDSKYSDFVMMSILEDEYRALREAH
jgi:RimJ/RimL family protein N-acetyltransferase